MERERLIFETLFADVFDALTADRPYRAAMPINKAIAILWDGAGQSHDPICIEALERALAKTSLRNVDAPKHSDEKVPDAAPSERAA